MSRLILSLIVSLLVVQGSGESVWAQNRRDDFCVIAH